MPKEFQEIITIKLPIPVRKKPNGVYEARFRKKGFDISVSSKDFEQLKPKFVEAFLASRPKAEEKEHGRETLFSVVAARWLELKRPHIKPNSYEFYESLLRVNILPAFADRDIREIKQSDVQAVINRYV